MRLVVAIEETEPLRVVEAFLSGRMKRASEGCGDDHSDRDNECHDPVETSSNRCSCQSQNLF